MNNQGNENQPVAQAAREFPESWPESEKRMSNFDHTIDDGLEDDLKAGMTASYPAWSFHGRVWFQDGRYFCRIMQYRQVTAILESDSLTGIMDQACERFGDA